MEGELLKLAALALSAVILIGIVKIYKPEYSILITLGFCIIILFYIADSLKYAIFYVSKLYDNLNYGKSYLVIIIKIIAVAYLTDFTSELCKDANENSIATKIELAGKISIFIISIPIFISIFQLVEELL